MSESRSGPDRLEVQNALRASAEKLRAVIENVPAGISISTPGRRIVEANPALWKMFGFSSKEEFTEGSASQHWYDPLERDRFVELMQRQGTVKEHETRFVRKDGSAFWVVLTSTNYAASDGETWMITATIDISERKRMEEALRQSERKYRGLFEESGDAIFIADAKTAIILDVNKRAEKLLGMPRHEIIGMNRADLHPKTEEFAREFESHVEAGKVNDAESTVIDKNGRHIPVRINATTFELGGRKVIQGIFRDISSSKRIEHDLVASEARYRRLFEAAKDGILILDAETGRIVDVNPFLVELTGYSHEEFLGKHLWEIGSFRDIAASKESFAELQTEKYVRYEDLPLKTRDGRKIAVEFVSNVYLVDDKKVIQCNIRDITGRKRAEENLARNFETEAALNSLLSLSLEDSSIEELLPRALELILSLKWLAIESKGAIFLADEAGKTLRLRAEKNFSQDLIAACTAVPFGRCLCGRAAAERAIQFADRVDERHDVRYPGIQPHGHYCVPILSGDRVLGVINLYVKEGHAWSAWEEGFLKAVANTLSGAVARKRGAEALRESEERFRVLFDQAADTILLLEITPGSVPVIRDANRSALTALGYQPEELVGQPVSFIEAGADASRLANERRRGILSGAGKLFEVQHRCKDGTIRDLECSVTEMRIGSKVLAISVERDITDRNKAEAVREKLEEQLRASQKLEAIGSLTGGIAHDFNNLLSVILSYTGFALDAVPEGEPLREDLLEVKNAGERSAALVRQLLAFSRKQMMEPVPLDLNQITAELEKMLRRILGEDIDFVQALAPDLGLTFADPGQIEQVLMNLVVNARDAMPTGGKLTNETTNTELDDEYAASHVAVEPGPYVMLAVTDTGRGMDEGTKARIFEPFFTTKEKGKGTGLGLSTAYGIVRQSGGDIHVYSEPGLGTTMKIYLPRKTSPAVVAPKVSIPPTRLTGSETILVVEDEEAVMNLAKRILDTAGYTVLTATSGDEALATCERHADQIHLVLTDVVMPGMGGREFAERLAKLRPGIKVLYMSGYTDDAIVHHGTLDAGTKFVGKPFNSTDLTRKVREVLDET
ncbi:MAG: PAS domain S-box protein [Proteobacteria bacterium]|jgi:PAS domain S-box-containing protein|nr:PAS domain S-box protein [Pseudomonadota bacterium]